MATSTIDAYVEQDVSYGLSASIAFRDNGSSGNNIYIGGAIDYKFDDAEEDYMYAVYRMTPTGQISDATALRGWTNDYRNINRSFYVAHLYID